MFETLKDNAFVIMMIVGVLQFVFTVLITWVLHRNAKRQLRSEVLRSIDAQWQDLNKMMIADPRIQQAIADPLVAGASPEQLVRWNIVYYVLKTWQHLVRARNQGFIDRRSAEDHLGGHVAFLRQFPSEVEKILATDSSFDSGAMEELRKAWRGA